MITKFICSSLSFRKWLMKCFPIRTDGDEEIDFELVNGELCCDGDHTLSLFVEARNNAAFKIKRSKIFRTISILQYIEDQPITVGIESIGWVVIDSVGI